MPLKRLAIMYAGNTTEESSKCASGPARMGLLVRRGGLPDDRRENKLGIDEPVITANFSAPGRGAMTEQARRAL